MNEFVGWFLEVDRMSIGIGYRRIKKKMSYVKFFDCIFDIYCFWMIDGKFRFF